MTQPSTLQEDLELLDALPGLPSYQQPAALERLLRNPSPEVRGPALRVGSAILSDDWLVGYLRDGRDDVLRNAGLEMLKLKGPKAFTLAASLLNDRDSDVALQSVLLLDHLRDPRALEALRGALKHSNPNVVQAVIVAIGHIGHAAAARDLFPFLHGDPWYQTAAIEALGSLRAPDAVGPLAGLLDDPMLGELAAQSIVWIGGPEAFRFLAQRWMDAGAEDDEFVDLLAHVLEGLTGAPAAVPGLKAALMERLQRPSGAHRAAAARCLLVLEAGAEADGIALRIVADEATDRETLPACLTSRKDLIGRLLGDRGILQTWGFLLAARYPDDVPMRELASSLSRHVGHEQLDAISEVLAGVRGVELGNALLEFYDRLPPDAHAGWGPVLRLHADAIVRAMERQPDVSEKTRGILTAILQEDAEAIAAGIVALPSEFRAEALTHVSDLDDVLAGLPWIDWLKQDAPRYAPIAAKAADRAGLQALLSEIRNVLIEQPSPDLIRLVANLRDADCVSVLVAILGDWDAGLYPFVIEALGVIGGDEGRQALRSVVRCGEPSWERFAYGALAKCFEEEDLPIFRKAVAHADWNVRLACAEVLGGTSLPEDEAALVQLFADPVPVVARRAGEVLGR